MDKVVEEAKEEELRKKVIKEVSEEVKKENTNEIIKAMIENKADYNFISKVTGKTIEEIKEIENTK